MRNPTPLPADVASTDTIRRSATCIGAPDGDLNGTGTGTAGADHSSLHIGQSEHGAQATEATGGPRLTSNDRQSSPVCCVIAQAYARTGSSHTERPCTARGPMFFDIDVNGYPATAMLDSGCSRNFVSAEFCSMMVQTPRLKKKADRFPVVLANGDRLSSSTVLDQATLTLMAQPGRAPCLRDPQDLDVLPGLQYDVLLGMPWLRQHNPTIDWSLGTIQLQGHTLKALDSRAPANADEFAGCCRVGEEDEILYSIDDQIDWLIRQNQWVSGHPDLVTVLVRPSDETPCATVATDTPPEELHPLAVSLLEQFRHVFAEPPAGLPPSRAVDHRIVVQPGHAPPSRPTRRMSADDLQELKRQVLELLDKEWIQTSVSPYGAGVLFAKKHDDSKRLCIDFRPLNSITIKNATAMPRQDEIFDQMQGATIFSKIDLRSGFHQIRVSPEDTEKTAFRTPYGHFEWRVMPFGLTNAPATFTRMMMDILRPYLNDFVVCLMDDICIYSRDEQSHSEHVRKVLQLLSDHSLYAKESKCAFFKKEIDFLGHRISGAGLHTSPAKVTAVSEWPACKSVRDVRAFVGFANFYRKFIPDFSGLTKPLTDLMGTDVPWRWGELEHTAFERLKKALTTAPVLALPDTSKGFTVTTDASKYAIGAVLSQETPEGVRPVAYESKKLAGAELNWPTHDKEAFAIVHAFKAWEHYLKPGFTTVYTDHAALQHLQTQPKQNERQIRWNDYLANFHLDIRYKPGAANAAADALSRRSDGEIATTAISLIDPDHSFLKLVKDGYAHDPYWAEMQASQDSAFQFADGLWFCKTSVKPRAHHNLPPGSEDELAPQGRCLCIPDHGDLRSTILTEHHDAPYSGHLGIKKTLSSLKRFFFWPGMKGDVTLYINSCDSCQRNKPVNQAPAGKLQSLPIATRRWQQVSLDLITGLPNSGGFDAILVMVDMFSKMIHAVPTLTTVTAEGVADLFFREIYRLHGLPEVLVSDRDPRFTGLFWQALWKVLGTKLRLSSPYHPQTDGQTERANRTLEEVLRAYVGPDLNDWHRYLPLAEFAYNNSTQASTGFSPFYLNSGQHPLTPVSMLNADSGDTVPSVHQFLARLDATLHQTRANILKAQQQQAAQADRHRRSLRFEVGDEVLLSTAHLRRADTAGAKLRERFTGPFQITEVVGPNAYRLDLPRLWRVHPVQNITNLRLYRDPTVDFPSRPPAPPPPLRAAEDNSAKIWDPESLLCKRRIDDGNGRQHWEVMVHWKDWGNEHDSWEPFESFNLPGLRWVKKLLPTLPLEEADPSPPPRRGRRKRS